MFNDLIKHPMYLLLHPIKGFDEFKRYKTGKLYVAIVFLILACLLSILRYMNTGFILNNNNPDDFNSIKLILFILVPVVLFTLSNWSITTLFDGKGTILDIFMMICYSLFPYVVISFPNLLFSNFVIVEEVDFFFMIDSIAVFLMCFMIFFGMISIHEYSVTKTILTTLCSFGAALVMLFIILLLFTLIQQFMEFIYSIYREISMRYF